jgi:hypothetical protein
VARFQGTVREFKRHIGPQLRNVVQLITRKQKDALGSCEHCGATGELEAAHVHGRDRTDIIHLLLGESDSDAQVDVDLAEFEAAFRSEHEPVERAILVLCSGCHRKYDATTVAAPLDAKQEAVGLPTGTKATSEGRDVLPISLFPPGHAAFKRALLDRREAVIEVLYADGSVERKPWNASRFAEDSNVFGNLRSRPEFRQGVWQANEVVKVNVRVVD